MFKAEDSRNDATKDIKGSERSDVNGSDTKCNGTIKVIFTIKLF